MDFAGIVIAIGVVGLILLALIVGGILFGARLRRSIFGGWETTAETLHLTYNDDDIYPKLSGSINGILTTAEIFNHTITLPNGKQSLQAWTRVRAHLPGHTHVTVRHRGQSLKASAEAPPQLTGSPDFDARFELFAPEGVDLDTLLPVAVQEALISAEIQLHIWKEAVVWMEARIVHDASELTRIMQTCAAVATAYRS